VRIARESLDLARATADPQIVQESAYVLLFALAGPDRLGERAALREEIERAALATPRRDTGLIALLDLASDRLMLGDAVAARELRRAAGALAGATPHLGMRWHLATYDAGLAALEGRLADAERLALEALAVGRRARHPFAQGCFDIHCVLVALDRGDPRVAIERFAHFTEERGNRWSVPLHWILALVGRARLALGDAETARALWGRLEEEGLAAIPRNIRWTRAIAEAAHLCADLGARERAEELAALLEPAAEQHAVVPIPIGYGGPLRYALARLYELLGRRGLAERTYAAALEDAERVGAQGWRARVLLDAARFAGDSRESRAWLEDSATTSEKLGQRELARAARAELERLAAAPHRNTRR
jgi:hypothetical protein